MLKSITLLLPILFPSWRFFDGVAPSPRIEFSCLETIQDTSKNWNEFRPRPAHASFIDMLKRMFWNPHWNESLFLVSCAERLIQEPTQHSEDEISQRIRHDLNKTTHPYFQFRLVFIYREETHVKKQITYTSKIFTTDGAAKA